MNSSTLKILVPVVLLIGVVFGLTLFSQYAPREDPGQLPEQTQGKKPLQFFTSRRLWVPEWTLDRNDEEYMTKLNLQDQIYPLYFESGETVYRTPFWFANRNPESVEVQLRAVSCSTCSGGQIAAIPPAVTKEILQMTAVAALPTGLVAGFPLGMIAPAAQLDPSRKQLPWQHHKFDKDPAQVRYEVPGTPTGDPWTEQWGILELEFKVKPGGMGGLSAIFNTRLKGSEKVSEERLELGYVSANPFELDKNSIDMGELTDAAPSQRHELMIYSSTRTPADLKRDLSILVAMPMGTSGEPGPFVSIGELTPVPPKELVELEKKMSSKLPKDNGIQPPVKVMSAFRLPVNVNPKVGNATLDIGRVERMVAFSQNSEVKQVRVFGTMRGPIALVGAKEVGFGFFSYADEQSLSVTIESNRLGLDLAIVNEMTQPKFLKTELQKLPDSGDRGMYKLKVTIPAKEQLGELKDGVVVVEAKGPNPLRLRIPVTGRGR